ncbi:MAG TPA: rhodanese-like domain-containing protein [Anaerolineaceae bacterium]|nr:rhodanese-like domain-containing protein [Anaerolineaceae bacterium]
MTEGNKKNRFKSQNNKNSVKTSSSKILIMIAAFAIILFAVFVLIEPGSKIEAGLPRTVNVDEAYELRQSGIFVLDVREQHEWDTVHIPGATLIPLGELDNRINELPKDEEILVVCRSGNRSATARDILLNTGFEDVTSLAGGMIDWVGRSYEVVSEVD